MPELGKGGLARVYLLQDFEGRQMAVKSVKFCKGEKISDSIYRQVEDYCFSKILSCLGVGPKVETFMGFDLVIYEDSIEFLMEKCSRSTILI